MTPRQTRVVRLAGSGLRALLYVGGFGGALALALQPLPLALTAIEILLVVGLVAFAVTAVYVARTRPLERTAALARPRTVGLFFCGVLAVAGLPVFPGPFLFGSAIAVSLLFLRSATVSTSKAGSSPASENNWSEGFR
jgi:hypothetical protein